MSRAPQPSAAPPLSAPQQLSAPPAIRWAQSGLMSLTGAEHGAPLVPAFDVMAGIHELMHELGSGAEAVGARLDIDASVLGGRAHLLKLRRGGAQSCNRTSRLLEARDGWIALSLPRPTDVDLLPAWLGVEVGTDPWQAVAERVKRLDRADLAAMAQDLPLAFAVLPDLGPGAAPAGAAEGSRASASAPAHASTAAPASTLARASAPARASSVSTTARASTPAREGSMHSALAIDLSALWAGPLCGQLLRQAGARVIKVESSARPETARQAWPGFFDLLNAGKESLVLDFDNAAHRARLRRLIEAADIVISSARPRALEQLDLDPAELICDRPALIWIAITAHGWPGSAGRRVGFGDDVAAGAGLLATGEDGRPAFMADAMADPLTGMSAAAAALRAYRQGAGGLHDVSLFSSAKRVADARRLTSRERGAVHACGADWRLRVDDFEAPVSAPWAFAACQERAAPAGAHTQRILEEIDR